MPATLLAAGFRAVRGPDPASNFVSIQKRLELCVKKPPGLCDEEDRKEEGTDKGAPESSEKNTSVYIRSELQNPKYGYIDKSARHCEFCDSSWVGWNCKHCLRTYYINSC